MELENKLTQEYPSIPADAGTYPNKIRELALEMGLSQSDLARVIGTANMTTYDICNGRRLPSFMTERKLELLFGIPISEMYNDPYKNIKLNSEFMNSIKRENS